MASTSSAIEPPRSGSFKNNANDITNTNKAASNNNGSRPSARWVSAVVQDAVERSSQASSASAAMPASSGFDRARSPLTRNDLQLSSAASCAASACHGGSRPGIAVASASRGSEYPLWIESDPHARSWQTICSDASLAMMERLKIFAGGEIVDRRAFDNCLACHNTTRQAHEPRSPELLREGIGCSGCHGPDQRWRSQHFTGGWNRVEALEDGFAQTKNMLSRARICATCHVGDLDRDMNHDIIAAGHPALHYEFSSFHQKQPKHWREAASLNRDRFEPGQWLAGQLAALDASMVLLETRAARRHSVSQWPELATYDCTSCHQPISQPSSAGPTPQSIRNNAPSTSRVSQWNQFGVLELLRLRKSEGCSSVADQELSHALQELTMTLRTLTADPQQVQPAAARVRIALDAWLKSPDGLSEVRDFHASRLLQLVQSAAQQENSYNRWETLTQIYLASVAGRSAWPGNHARLNRTEATNLMHDAVIDSTLDPVRDDPVRESANKLRQSLIFPIHTNSPPCFLPDAPINLQRHVRLLSPMPELVPAPKL